VLEEHPTLFKQFAELPPAPDAIKQFATQYGNLFANLRSGAQLRSTLDDWQEQTFRMRCVLELWEAAVVNSDWLLNRALVELARVAEKGPLKPYQVVAAELVERMRGDLLTGGGVASKCWQAVFVVGDVVTEQLSEMAPFFERAAPSTGSDPVPPQPLKIGLRPKELHQAVWWQCARFLTDGTLVRQCPQCKEWFTVQPPITRTTRKFCSDRCKQAAYRHKQKAKESQS